MNFRRWLLVHAMLDNEGGGGGAGAAVGTQASGATGAGAAAGTAGAEKTFTQADLDRFAGQARLDERKKYADYDALKTAATENAELKKKLEENELKGKSAEERERIAAQKAAAEIERARKDAEDKAAANEKRAVEAETKHRRYRLEIDATTALTAAKALPKMLKHATTAFLAEVEIDQDEKTGDVTAVRYGGVARKDLKDAATAWLADNDGFAEAPGGGAGSPRPNGGAGPADFSKMTPEQLVSLGWAQK